LAGGREGFPEAATAVAEEHPSAAVAEG
jgi:hypothetical protein